MVFSVLQFGHVCLLVSMSDGLPRRNFAPAWLAEARTNKGSGLMTDDSDEESGDDSSTHYLLGAFF